MNKVILFTILLIFFFSTTNCSKNNIVFKEITCSKFKILAPNNWKIVNDEENNMIFMSHPELDYKYRIDFRWANYEGIDNMTTLNKIMASMSKDITDNRQELIFDSKNACNSKGEFTICKYEITGIDMEGDHSILATYNVTNPKIPGHLEYTVRVSKPEFTSEQNELTKQILNSIEFL